MNGNEIVEVVKEYLGEGRDEYALMLTGEWGSGKTYFVEHVLTKTLEEDTAKHSVIIASAYGVKDVAELCGAIEAGFLSKYAVGKSDGEEMSKKDSLVKIAKDTGASFLGKKIRDLEKKMGVDFQIAPFNAINLLIGPQVLLVIDDVERCPMPPQELLGAVNRLVTSCGKKVLLVCNEEEWRKRWDDQEEGDSSCKQFLEKTVWRICRFEPSVVEIVNEVLGDVLEGIYPGAAQDVSSAMDVTGMSNFRSLCKMRPVLEAIKESGFFLDAYDKKTAKLILKDVCGFAARAAKGEHFVSPSGSKNDTMGFWLKNTEFSKYATLEFIPRFFERYEGVDPNHVRSCLEEYLESYYPEGPDARRASESLEKIRYFLFYDRDVPELIEDIIKGILPQDGGKGLAFDRYPDALRAVSEIAERFDLSRSYGELVEKMRAAIQKDPEAAAMSISKHSVDWQAAAFDPSGEFTIREVDEIDELREIAFEARRRNKRDALCACLEDGSDVFADDLYRAFSENDDILGTIRALVGMDTDRLVESLRGMSPERLERTGEVLFSGSLLCPTRLLLDEGEKPSLIAWMREMAEKIKELDALECYQMHFFDAMVYNFEKILSDQH